MVTTGFLGNVQTSLNVLSPIFSGGADPTGTNDSSAAFQAALNAVPSTGGVVGVPPGVYKVGTALTVPVLQTYITGAGRGVTQINSYVTGDCIRAYGTATANSQTGGGIIGLTIDGTHAGNNSSGIHVGDMYRPVFDQLAVQNFTGTGSKNIWFDNNYSWMEQATGRIWSTNSKNLVVFDNSVNTSGGATGSFDRTCMDIFLINEAAGNGVTFQNGAEIYDGKLGIYGNFSVGQAGTAYTVLTITGSNTPDGYSRIASSQLNIGVELAGANTTVAAGSNGGTISAIATWGGTYGGNGVLDVASTSSWPTAGTITVAASSSTTAVVTYTGVSGTSFTGCAYVSGSPSGTISTGGAVINDNGNTPNTITFGSAGNNQIKLCNGNIDFGANNTFANAVNEYFGSFQFDGPVIGDTKLARSMGTGMEPFNQGSVSSSTQIDTLWAATTRVTSGSAVTGMILESLGSNVHGGICTVINYGTNTITFAASGTSHVANGTACTIPATTATTFWWDYLLGLWYPAN